MVDVHIIDDDDSDFGKRPASVLIGLPDELAEWANQNHGLISKVLRALKDSYANLSEDQIWETIAEVSDHRWKKAHDALLVAEEEINKLKHPMHASLGAIGQALDSEKTDRIEEHHRTSLAEFTIINEGLSQRPDLQNLFKVLQVQKRMVHQSAGLTRQTQRASRKLAGILSLRDDFAHAARRSIRRQFMTYAQKLLVPKKRQKAHAANVSVPWSQGT